jgi:hypothetical protein
MQEFCQKGAQMALFSLFMDTINEDKRLARGAEPFIFISIRE